MYGLVSQDPGVINLALATVVTGLRLASIAVWVVPLLVIEWWVAMGKNQAWWLSAMRGYWGSLGAYNPVQGVTRTLGAELLTCDKDSCNPGDLE